MLAERSALHIEVVTNQATLMRVSHTSSESISNWPFHVSRKMQKTLSVMSGKIFYLTLLKCTTVYIVAPGHLLVISDSVLVDV